MIEKIDGGDNSIDLEYIDPDRSAIHIHGGWITTWPSMPNTTLMETQKYQEVVNSQ
jgi:hypothetical protein